jgi:hypothetical protein
MKVSHYLHTVNKPSELEGDLKLKDKLEVNEVNVLWELLGISWLIVQEV